MTVTGVNDNLVDGTITSTITVAVNDGSSDNNFDPVNDQTVSVSTVDDDTASSLSCSRWINRHETGTADTFTVVLDAQPNSNVVLSVTSGDTGEALVSTGTLTFTSGNWNTGLKP